jgi:hypothetical protein
MSKLKSFSTIRFTHTNSTSDQQKEASAQAPRKALTFSSFSVFYSNKLHGQCCSGSVTALARAVGSHQPKKYMENFVFTRFDADKRTETLNLKIQT